MPPKGAKKTEVTTTEPPVVATPKAIDRVGLDVTSSIGKRESVRIMDAPVIISDAGGHTGTGKIMEIRPTPVTVESLQPFLTKEEAVQLGVQRWYLYPHKVVDNDRVKHEKNTIFTSVVNGRRFFVTKDIYEAIDKD